MHGEWEVDEIFFSYQEVPYDTGLGLDANVEEHAIMELFISPVVRRKSINAFTFNLVPFFVVALLLFAQIFIVSGKEDQIERFGFTVNDSMTTCSSIFFVVLLAHGSDKKKAVC